MSIVKRIIESFKSFCAGPGIQMVQVGEGKFNVYLPRDTYAELARQLPSIKAWESVECNRFSVA